MISSNKFFEELVLRISESFFSRPKRDNLVPRVLSYQPILGDPGAVSRAGLKGATKVFKHRRKSPWVPTLTGLFPNGQENAGSWLGTKNALYYCAQSANSTKAPEFFSWVRTQRLLSRHSCPVCSLSFPDQKRRNYRWVEKRFGCYQQEQFNLHWENSVSDGSQCIVSNRKFKMKRRRERKKSNSLTRQNSNFARASHFFVYFFAITARLPRENA